MTSDCSICLMPLVDNLVFTPCMHKYHKSCLDEHIAFHTNKSGGLSRVRIPCPQCKFDISELIYGNEDLDGRDINMDELERRYTTDLISAPINVNNSMGNLSEVFSRVFGPLIVHNNRGISTLTDADIPDLTETARKLAVLLAQQ